MYESKQRSVKEFEPDKLQKLPYRKSYSSICSPLKWLLILHRGLRTQGIAHTRPPSLGVEVREFAC